MRPASLIPRGAWGAAFILLLCLTTQVRAAFPGGSSSDANSGPGTITLRVQTPDYILDADGLRVPGYGVHNAPGAPALPVWATVVELPPAGEWTIAVEPGAAVEIRWPNPLPAVPVPQPVQPGPEGWSAMDELPPAVPVLDRPDPAIYAVDAFYPADLAQAGRVQWQRGRRLLALRVFPFQYNPVQGKLRYYADITVTVSVREKEGRGKKEEVEPRTEVINRAAGLQADGGGLRISTAGQGMVGLTYDALVAEDAAVAAADPDTFAVSYLGQRADILIVDQDADGQFESGDLVVFYAEPYAGRYQNQNVYWFGYGGTGSAAMATRSVTPTGSEPVVDEIVRTLHVESDKLYMSTIHRARDANHWFDGPLGAAYGPIRYTLDLVDPVLTGELTLQALINSGPTQSTEGRSISMSLNAHDAGTFAWTGLIDYEAVTTAPASWLDAAPNQLGLLPGTGVVYPDWIEVTYPSQAVAHGDFLYIESLAEGANEVQVTGFSTGAVRVYDIRDPLHPVLLTTTAFDAGTGTLSFWDADISGPTYFLSTDAALAAPLAIELPVRDGTPTLLAAPENQADYIAIVHRSLWSAIDPLLAHRHDDDGFIVAKVDVQQVYDEFSYGRRDPEAVRSFLAYAYQYWKGPDGAAAPPQYVVLVGDGHYDFTGASGTVLPNLIPPYLADVDPWMGETPADNRFVSIDPPENGEEDILPEMAVGRIPAQTAAEVTAVVDKVLAYEETAAAGDWQRRAYYAADSCMDGGGDFHFLSNQSRLGFLPGAYDDRTVYYSNNVSSCPETDHTTASAMQAGIRSAFDGGALMLQWYGHAARSRWGTAAEYPAGELPIYVLSSNVVAALNANTVWPVTFSYTCLSGRFTNLDQPWFVDYMDETIGEALVVTAGRGSVADLSPSGQHVGSALVVLNQGVTKAIFQSRVDRMGLAIDTARVHYYMYASMFLDIIDTSILFGDPATQLRLPPLAGIARHLTTTTTAVLSWQHVPQYTRYEIWRSPKPYFAPGDAGSEKRGELPAPTGGDDLLFDDAGAVGNPAVNAFYVIHGINAYGTSGASNRVGEFDFALTPGN